MIVFLPQLTMIDIEIPALFPSGSACAHTRGRIEIRDAIAKIIGVVRCFAARANGVRRFTGDHPLKQPVGITSADRQLTGPGAHRVGDPQSDITVRVRADE
jgi:hypothetical protein